MSLSARVVTTFIYYAFYNSYLFVLCNGEILQGAGLHNPINTYNKIPSSIIWKRAFRNDAKLYFVLNLPLLFSLKSELL